MSYFTAKMHWIWFWLGLCPQTLLGERTVPPRRSSCIWGVLFLRQKRGRQGRGDKREGKKQSRKKEGKRETEGKVNPKILAMAQATLKVVLPRQPCLLIMLKLY